MAGIRPRTAMSVPERRQHRASKKDRRALLEAPRHGATVTQAAAVVPVGTATVRRWRTADPAFAADLAAAIEAGKRARELAPLRPTPPVLRLTRRDVRRMLRRGRRLLEREARRMGGSTHGLRGS